MCRCKCFISMVMLFASGCMQEMADQPRYDAFEPRTSPADGGGPSLGPIEGTIARGQLQLDDAYFTGKDEEGLVIEVPAHALAKMSMQQLLSRGQQRFVIVCAHCHGQVGGGIGGSDEMRELVGMVVKRGFPMPPTFHQPRLREVPIGHFFDVITNGLGRMPAHDYMVAPQDRWAIAAYVRALQFSQNAPGDELSALDVQELEKQSAGR